VDQTGAHRRKLRQLRVRASGLLPKGACFGPPILHPEARTGRVGHLVQHPSDLDIHSLNNKKPYIPFGRNRDGVHKGDSFLGGQDIHNLKFSRLSNLDVQQAPKRLNNHNRHPPTRCNLQLHIFLLSDNERALARPGRYLRVIRPNKFCA
jgi:hypothetical protein